MISKIITNPELFSIIIGTCDENQVFAGICDEFLKNGDIDDDTAAILKIDRFYNTRNFAEPPPAIDCLFVLEKHTKSYSLTLVELKNVGRPSSLDVVNIRRKFNTTIEDFMGTRFAEIFCDPVFNIIKFRTILITNLYSKLGLDEEQFRRKIRGTCLDYFNTIKPFSFRGKMAILEIYMEAQTICA